MGPVISRLNLGVGNVRQPALHFVLDDRGEPRQILLQTVLDKVEGEVFDIIEPGNPLRTVVRPQGGLVGRHIRRRVGDKSIGVRYVVFNDQIVRGLPPVDGGLKEQQFGRF
jgi:hypothetical protein